MAYLVQQKAPDWSCEGLMPDKTMGPLTNKSFEGKYLVFFYYPLDFTFVCPTEIIAFSDKAAEFRATNAELLAASCDNIFTHLAWVNTPRKDGGLGDMKIPILSDFTKEVASAFGCLVQSGPDKGVPLRALFIISPTGIVRHMTVNDLPVGRNVDEALRLVKAFQFVDEHGEVCPANWKPGDKSMKADPKGKLEWFADTTSETAASAPGASNGIVEIKTRDEFNEYLSGGKPFIAFFSASWCGNCRKVTPIVAGHSSDPSAPAIIKIDSEAMSELSDEHEVSSLPTFISFAAGKPGNRYTGSVKKKVTDFIKKNSS